MSIYLDQDSRVIVQGITGSAGAFHTRQMLDYGTKVVGGVTPGKAGAEVEGVPVFDSVSQAVRGTGADVSVIFVPPRSPPTRSARGSTPGSPWSSASRKGSRCWTW